MRISRRGSGFTLIELIVVVSIIALLVAILLPALGAARLRARKSSVLAQLHGIGGAMAAYENEYNRFHPTELSDANQDGRAFGGLALLCSLYHFSPKLFINQNTADMPATQFNAAGWPILADIDGAEINATTPASIDSSNISRVRFHCSFSYDHEKKRTGDIDQMRIYLGDRADYQNGRAFSGNWGPEGSAGGGMCVLFTDQHAEFITSQSIQYQSDPNIYHHNEFGGEGATETLNGISVTPNTLDTHLRFFSEDEDNALLPRE